MKVNNIHIILKLIYLQTNNLLMNFRAIIRIIDFFIPFNIITAVFVVFALENVVSHYFALYIPPRFSGPAWIIIAILGLALMNIASADEEEIDELEEDIEDIRE